MVWFQKLIYIRSCQHFPDLVCLTILSFEFFTVGTKLAEMAILYSKDLTTAKKVTSSAVGHEEVIFKKSHCQTFKASLLFTRSASPMNRGLP